MPNGGSDCCGNCVFNRAVQDLGPNPSLDRLQEFWRRSYCTLRDVDVSNPFYTYCESIRFVGQSAGSANELSPEGDIYASGLQETPMRIPWHGKVEPRVAVPCVCSACGRQVEQGITIKHQGGELGFCSNGHYVDWWQTEHEESK
jgi:hypothetical protein